MSPEDELAELEAYKKDLEAEEASLNQELSEVEERIKELKRQIESAPQAPTSVVPQTPFPPMTFPIPPPSLTKEQEKQMLEHQAKGLEDQMDIIRKRLAQLKKEE